MHLNAHKAKMLLVGSLFTDFYVDLEGGTVSQTHAEKNLGTIFDPSLIFEPHIKYTAQTVFFDPFYLNQMLKSSSSKSSYQRQQQKVSSWSRKQLPESPHDL